MTRGTVAGLAVHVFFELAAGVGMPLASVLGPVRAAGLWAAATGALWHQAGHRSPRSDPAFAIVNAAGLAAVAAHLMSWPTRRTRPGLPWLEDCEGLGPDLMPFYNPVLYVSGFTATVGLFRENRSAAGRATFVALLLTPALAIAQRREFRRLLDQSRAHPSWSTRRLAKHGPGSPVTSFPR
jgi:hypothetical protein